MAKMDEIFTADAVQETVNESLHSNTTGQTQGTKRGMHTSVLSTSNDVVFISDPQLLVGTGQVTGVEHKFLEGHSTNVSTTEVTLWPENTIVAFPTSAATMSVTSPDSDDAAAGTGARTVLIEGLDANYVEVLETVTLGDTTTTAFLRVNKMSVVTAGSSRANEGIVYIGTGSVTSGKPAVVVNLIEADGGHSRSCFFTTPAAKFISLLTNNVNPRGSKLFTTQIITHTNTGLTFRGAETHSTESNPFAVTYPTRLMIPKLDIEIRGQFDTGSGEGGHSVSFLLINASLVAAGIGTNVAVL